MRHIVNRIPDTRVVDLANVHFFFDERIIAYETYKKNGLAILIKRDCNEYGFAYHSNLLSGRTGSLKFEGCNPRTCVEKALRANRTVIEFESAKEFIEYAADFSKL